MKRSRGYLDRLNDRRAPAAEQDRARRHVALWVAVGGTMFFIVALWALVLPTQLGAYADGGLQALFSSPPAPVAALSPDEEWRETMRAATAGLERASAGFAESLEPSAPADPLDAEALTARLEASSPDETATAPVPNRP